MDICIPSVRALSNEINSLILPQMLVCANVTIKTFNHVCSSSNMDFVVAVTDSNVVSIWRRLKPLQISI
jgi:hypothetical protein